MVKKEIDWFTTIALGKSNNRGIPTGGDM